MWPGHFVKGEKISISQRDLIKKGIRALLNSSNGGRCCKKVILIHTCSLLVDVLIWDACHIYKATYISTEMHVLGGGMEMALTFDPSMQSGIH